MFDRSERASRPTTRRKMSAVSRAKISRLWRACLIVKQLKKERDRVEQQLSRLSGALTAFAGAYRGAVNREGRHLEVNYEFAARSRHSQQSLTF
jgi:hypothetical protein